MIVLMVFININYKFVYVEIGCNGRISDGGIFYLLRHRSNSSPFYGISMYSNVTQTKGI